MRERPPDGSPPAAKPAGPASPGSAESAGTAGEDAWLARLREVEAAEPLDSWGDYEVIEEVGRGGQGVVYRGRHRPSGRVVALKRLHAADDVTKARAREEVAAVRSLRHEAIVEILAVESWGGRDVIVMEWVDGRTVLEWAKERSLREVVALALGVALGLLHAHQHGVLHRDIKPSNLLVDVRGRPRILDFGIARRSTRTAQVTTSGEFLGTLAYATPEQILRPPEHTDVRSDLYALAVVIFEMLAGAPPHPRDGSLPQLLHAILEVPPAPLCRLRPEADASLQAVLEKALEKEPADRYRSVDAFAADLERWLRGEPVQARAVGSRAMVGRWVRRHRLASALLLTVAFLLLASSAIVGVLGARATRSAQRVERLQHFLETAVEGSWSVATPDADGATDLLTAASDRAAVELAEESAIEAKVRNRLAGQFAELDLWSASAREAKRALELATVAPDVDPVDRTVALHRLGYAQVMSGDRSGLHHLEEAIRHHESIPDARAADFVFLHARLGLALRRGVDPPDLDGALVQYQRALELLDAPDADAAANAPGLLHGYGDLLRTRQEWEPAARKYEAALAAYAARPRPLRRAHMLCAEAAGDAAMHLEDFETAERHFRLAIDLRRGESDDRLPAVIANMGSTLLYRDRPAEALGLFQDALATRLERLATLRPERRTSLLALAVGVRASGLSVANFDRIHAAIAEADAAILPLFELTSGRIALCYRRLGEERSAALLETALSRSRVRDDQGRGVGSSPASAGHSSGSSQ